MVELLPLSPNIGPKFEEISEMSDITNNWGYYQWLNGPSLTQYLQSSEREFIKPWGIQGYFQLPINPIPYDGSFPIGIRVGYARITSKNRTNQNYHLHPYSPEVLFLFRAQGEAYFVANGKEYPLPMGPSVVVVPPGVPHDIEVSGTLYTMDVKNFDTHRKDGLSRDRLEEQNNNGPNFNLIRTGPVFVDALSHGVPVVYNPNEESLLELAQMGYNCGWLVLIHPSKKIQSYHFEKIKVTDRALMKQYNSQQHSSLIPALFIADFDLTLSQ